MVNNLKMNFILVGCEGSQGDWGPSSVGHSGRRGRQRQGRGHRLGLLHGFRWIRWGLIDYSADFENLDDNWLHHGFWELRLRLQGSHDPTISNQTETVMIERVAMLCRFLHSMCRIIDEWKFFSPMYHHV